MRITLKLFANLGQLLPAGATANTVEVEVPDDSCAHDVLDRFRVPRERVHLVLLNGIYLDLPARDTTAIRPGDVLAVWPPVAGG